MGLQQLHLDYDEVDIEVDVDVEVEQYPVANTHPPKPNTQRSYDVEYKAQFVFYYVQFPETLTELGNKQLPVVAPVL